jgi:hypothetical protein
LVLRGRVGWPVDYDGATVVGRLVGSEVSHHLEPCEKCGKDWKPSINGWWHRCPEGKETMGNTKNPLEFLKAAGVKALTMQLATMIDLKDENVVSALFNMSLQSLVGLGFSREDVVNMVNTHFDMVGRK